MAWRLCDVSLRLQRSARSKSEVMAVKISMGRLVRLLFWADILGMRREEKQDEGPQIGRRGHVIPFAISGNNSESAFDLFT